MKRVQQWIDGNHEVCQAFTTGFTIAVGAALAGYILGRMDRCR